MVFNKIFLAILVLCYLYFDSHAQNVSVIESRSLDICQLITDNSDDMVLYKIALPDRGKSNIFSEAVIKIIKDKKRPTFLWFPMAGNQTDVIVIDNDEINKYKSISDCPVVKQLGFKEELGMLDISDIKRGTYIIRYISCSIGGSFRLILTD